MWVYILCVAFISRATACRYARGANLKATYNPVTGILTTESYASGVNLKTTYNRFRNVLVTLALILAFVLGASRVFVLGVAV